MPRKRKVSTKEADVPEYEPSEPDAINSRSRIRTLRDLSIRFTKSANALDLDMSFCHRCRIIDFVAVFEATEQGEDLNGTIIAYLEPFSATSTKVDCEFCAALSRTGLSKDGRHMRWEHFQLCVFDSLTIRGFSRTKARLKETLSVGLTVLFPWSVWIDQQEDPAFIFPVGGPGATSQRQSRFTYQAR